jgi:hypothetical protein
MNTFKQYMRFIAKRRGQKASYKEIGFELGITSAEVRRIGNGKYPGEKVAKRLGIPVICFACHRRIPKPRAKVVRPKRDSYFALQSLMIG